MKIKRKGGQLGRDSQLRAWILDVKKSEKEEARVAHSSSVLERSRQTSATVPSPHAIVHRDNHNSPAAPETFAVATP